MRVAWPNVLAWRMHQHCLDTRVPATHLLDVSRQLCGLHAQVMSSAELTLWARIDDLPKDAVQKALWDSRVLVKVWAMRGTLHLFDSADYPMWQAALSTMRRDFTPAWLNWYGLTRAELEQLIVAIGDVLENNVLTRTELAEAVATHTKRPEFREKILQSSWGSMLKPPTRRGQLCFGPSSGQNVRFTRPSSWLPNWQSKDPDASLLEVGRRYLHTYGPATVKQFTLWWGGAAGGNARGIFKKLGDEVTTIDLDGVPVTLLARDLEDLVNAEPQRTVRLLPAFDQYVVGAPREPSPVLKAGLKPRVYRNQGWFTPVLLVDGRMLGVWRHTRVGSRLKVDIEAFETLPRWVKKAAEDEAAKLSNFLGGKLDLRWQPLDQRDDMQQQSGGEAAS